MNREPSWDLYRTFLAVLDSGSLSGAARQLGLTQPTVSRHIDAFEEAVGAELFVRSQRGLAPTDTARELRPFAETLSATVAAMLRVASAEPARVAGTVRITASEVIAIEVLPPILTELRHKHPRLIIELAASDALDDLLRRDSDVAVRMVTPEQSQLLAKRVGDVHIGLFAHRDYLASRGKPATLDELRDHSVIGFERESPFTRALRQQFPALDRFEFALRTESNLAQLAALRGGFGIGGCQTAIARRQGCLVRVLEREVEIPLPVWVVMHENLRAIARYRAVFDALVAGLSAYVQQRS